jgi:hypothetical protein
MIMALKELIIDIFREKHHEDECVWLAIAHEQRHTELERGLDKSGTYQYDVMGCYKCDGLNKNCQTYLVGKNK